MHNVLSIDLETWIYYYDHTLGKNLGSLDSDARKRIDNGYVIHATDWLLERLRRTGRTATFFVLGEIHDWYPGLIERVAEGGHEVGYHTHRHRVVNSAAVLEQELEASTRFLETFRPSGFRAPQIYLAREAVPLLASSGFRYSSSTYGDAIPQTVDGIDEIPVSIYRWKSSDRRAIQFPKHLSPGILAEGIPFGSGLILGLAGNRISKWIESSNRRGLPAVVFVHPWQLLRPPEISGVKFRWRGSLASPLSFPYHRTIDQAFERMLERCEFVSFRESYYDGASPKEIN